MARFQRGYWIVMSNSAGELDRVFVKEDNTSGERMAEALIRMIEDTGTLNAGDSFTVVEGESEIVNEE
jgi:hypothetical protein